MNECQLTQNISQLSLKPGEEEIKKKDGGNFGRNRNPILQEFAWSQLQLWEKIGWQ